jgi:hypothetical protein
MHALLLAAALSIVPQDGAEPVSDCVSSIELNHFYDEQGRQVFEQCIFREWNRLAERENVVAWRLVKTPNQIPQFDWSRGCYRTVWFDGDFFRDISSRSLTETWTQYDPELYEREFLPKEQRRELSSPKVRRKQQMTEPAIKADGEVRVPPDLPEWP